jgi:hypothetical protein
MLTMVKSEWPAKEHVAHGVKLYNSGLEVVHKYHEPDSIKEYECWLESHTTGTDKHSILRSSLKPIKSVSSVKRVRQGRHVHEP